MKESFEFPVTFKGKELLFPASLQETRYSHRFSVDVFGKEIFFEPDEERNYRAMIDPEQLEENRKIDIDLLKAISKA